MNLRIEYKDELYRTHAVELNDFIPGQYDVFEVSDFIISLLGMCINQVKHENRKT